MTEVLLQYEKDIGFLKRDNPNLAADLSGRISRWVQPALTSLPAFREHPGRIFRTDPRKLFLRAFEVELFLASAIDFVVPEFWDVRGQKTEVEIYCDKEAFEQACAESNAGGDPTTLTKDPASRS